MKMKKTVIALGAALILGLTGCGRQTQINVEQAGMLASAATSTDKFAGVVVSENVVEIDRDTEKQIDELYVAAGDVVRVNEKLFEYDTDTLSLAIDKQELEMDKLDQQIKDLQAEVLDLSGGSAEMPTMSTDPSEQDEQMAQQLEAYDIFNQIKAAYADFDREKLEELIPQMDKRLGYLSSEALTEYYLILEYVEQPSNG